MCSKLSPKWSLRRQQASIISQLLRVRDPGTVCWVALGQVSGLPPSRGLLKGRSAPSSLTWLWAEDIGPLPGGVLHGMPADFSQHQDERQSFNDLISEMTAYHFCCALFIRSNSPHPAHTPMEGITQGVSIMGSEDHWATLEPACSITFAQNTSVSAH